MLKVILSFAFVFLMIFIATLIQKLVKLSNEFSRKIIHVAVGHRSYESHCWSDGACHGIIPGRK